MKNGKQTVILDENKELEKKNKSSTKISDILFNLSNQDQDKHNKTHKRSSSSMSNDTFTEKIMKEINSGELNQIFELFDEPENEENTIKKHSKHPTECLDSFRLGNLNKNKIKDLKIDNRKTVAVSDKLHAYDNDIDDSDNEDDNKDENCLSYIMGNNLEKFNEENNGIILNEKSNQLIEELKKENVKEYIKTGTKIDFVEELEGKTFNPKKDYKEFEKYISKIDDTQEKTNDQEESQNDKLSKLIKYDIFSTNDNMKIFKEFSSNKYSIFDFDKNNNIYIATEKGNVLIYNINEEKKIKELDNPFKDEQKNRLYQITAMSTDEKYIICAYTNGKIALFKKGKGNKLNKTKLYMALKEIYTQNIIIEIKVLSDKKHRIFVYFIDNKGKICRIKIYKTLFKKSTKLMNISINPNNDYLYYNLQINPHRYKCIGMCNSNDVIIYYISKKGNKRINKDPEELPKNNIFPNFCFLNFVNEKENSKFLVSMNSDSVILYAINPDYTNCIELDNFKFKDPIIKIGVFINEVVYIFDKENQMTLININSKNQKITQKLINGKNNQIFDKNNFEYKYCEDLAINKSIFCNNNRNFIINSNKNIFLITPLTLEQTINEICTKNDTDKWKILFGLCKDIYNDIHPIWQNKDCKDCNSLIIDKINICINEIINNPSNNSNKKMEKLTKVLDFLFHNNLYNFITSEEDGFYSKIKDIKIYFYLLESFIIQNKMLSIPVPLWFLNKMIELYKEENKKSWLCELLSHFNIKKLCDDNNNYSLINTVNKNNLINCFIYFIMNNIKVNNDFSYYKPVVEIFFNLIKQTKDFQRDETINKFQNIIDNNEHYKEMQDYNSEKNENNNKNDKNNENENKIEINETENDDIIKNEFIELNRYNDDLLLSNYYLRIKLFWYIYIIICKIGVNEDNKEECQELLKKGLGAILNPLVYDIIEKNNSKEITLNLDREIRFLIIKIFKDEEAIELCEIDKQGILDKIRRLTKNKYISEITYNFIYLRAYLDDPTLEVNKDMKMNILLFFMNYNIDDDYKELKNEMFEQDLITLLKNIDSFTFDDNDKILKTSILCKDKYPKLYDYIINNFKESK